MAFPGTPVGHLFGRGMNPQPGPPGLRQATHCFSVICVAKPLATETRWRGISEKCCEDCWDQCRERGERREECWKQCRERGECRRSAGSSAAPLSFEIQATALLPALLPALPSFPALVLAVLAALFRNSSPAPVSVVNGFAKFVLTFLIFCHFVNVWLHFCLSSLSPLFYLRVTQHVAPFISAHLTLVDRITLIQFNHLQ